LLYLQMEVLEFLLHHVANPMLADHTGCTPTIAAAANGRVDVLRRMVKMVRGGGGGDDEDGGGGDDERWSPARAANGPSASSSSKESPAARVQSSDPKRRRASLIALIASDVSRHEWRELASSDAQGNPALHWAAAGGHVAAAKVLMHEAHLRLEARDHEGRSVLMVAVQHRQLAMVMMLVKLGADVRTAAKCGLTALMQSAALADVAMLELLMQRGASLKATDAMGRTALHMAAGADDALPIVRHLLRLKMDVNRVRVESSSGNKKRKITNQHDDSTSPSAESHPSASHPHWGGSMRAYAYARKDESASRPAEGQPHGL
jgi:ankyrin repeat protein